MESKSPLKSTKVWLAIAAGVSAVGISLVGLAQVISPEHADAIQAIGGAISGSVVAIIGAVVAVLRVAEGNDPSSPEQPLKGTPSQFAPLALAFLFSTGIFFGCSPQQRIDAKPCVDASLDVAAIVACGPTIEAFCAEGRPLHGDERCADWKMGCALGEPIAFAIVEALFKAPLSDNELRPEDVAAVCTFEDYPWCDRVGVGSRLLLAPGAE